MCTGSATASAIASRSTITRATRCGRIGAPYPSFLLQRAGRDRPLVHLFDEPQFSIQDGYIGFMLEFFERLRREGHVVFLCVHPNEPFHLQILREACERFVFVQRGQLTEFADFDALVARSFGARPISAGSRRRI